MNIGSDCLVCHDGELLLGRIQSVFRFNVVVELFRDGSTLTVEKGNIIQSVSPESFEFVREHYQLIVK